MKGTDIITRFRCQFWYFSTPHVETRFIQKILAELKNEGITADKWTKDIDGKLGLIFIGGYRDYDELISFFQLQLSTKAVRVCVVNTVADLFEGEYKLRILRYGVECFLERAYFSESIECLSERINRWNTVERLLNAPVIREKIIGNSAPAITMLRSIIEVALYSTNNVLLLGERGVGKEKAASVIHELDTRKDKGDFVVMDCATLNKELAGSELFGHERGAFTGAEYGREGAVAQAHKGTFFMDEISEMPTMLQAEFLRVIQEGSYKKVGSNIWKHAEFRLVAASNRDLTKAAEEGNFRSDLLDRISVTVIHIPSLDERKEDIPSIIDFCFGLYFKKNIPLIENEVYDYLKKRNYPGNIRELRNILSNIFLRYPGKGPVTLGDLPEKDMSFDNKLSAMQWFEKKELLELLDEAFEEGYDLKQIKEVIQSLSMKITLQKVGKNRDVSRILGKSERWVQMQKIKKND